jgi:hypothetical protein
MSLVYSFIVTVPSQVFFECYRTHWCWCLKYHFFKFLSYLPIHKLVYRKNKWGIILGVLILTLKLHFYYLTIGDLNRCLNVHSVNSCHTLVVWVICTLEVFAKSPPVVLRKPRNPLHYHSVKSQFLITAHLFYLVPELPCFVAFLILCTYFQNELKGTLWRNTKI